MKDNLAAVVGAVMIGALLFVSAMVSISVWNECRETNSFFYCVRLVSK